MSECPCESTNQSVRELCPAKVPAPIFYVAMTRQKTEPAWASPSSSSSSTSSSGRMSKLASVVALLLAALLLPPSAHGLDTGAGGSGRGFSSSSVLNGNGIIGYNHISGGGVGIQVGGNGDSRCPRMCTCSGQTVDCSNRGLGQVPRRIPVDTERL